MKSTAFDMAMVAYRQNDMEGCIPSVSVVGRGARCRCHEYGSKYV